MKETEEAYRNLYASQYDKMVKRLEQDAVRWGV